MKSRTSRRVKKLLRMIEEKQEDIIRCEEDVKKARRKLLNKERGWSKAKYSKVKMKYTEKVRGLRGTINRLEKQRLNIERQEREKEEEELEDLEKSRAIEAEEERILLKEKRAKKRKKMKKKIKKKEKGTKKKAKKVLKKLSKDEEKRQDFVKIFVKEYRSKIRSKLKKKRDRTGYEIYGKYPFKVTIVYKVPKAEEKGEGDKKTAVKKAAGPTEVMLVFSKPKAEELELGSVEESAFDLGEYKEIFRTIVLQVSKWSEKEALAMAREYVERDTS